MAKNELISDNSIDIAKSDNLYIISELKKRIITIENEEDLFRQIKNLLNVENEYLKYENSELKNKIYILKNRIAELSKSIDNTFQKFHESDEKLIKLLSIQKMDFSKRSLGYVNDHDIVSSFNNGRFVRVAEIENSNIVQPVVNIHRNL